MKHYTNSNWVQFLICEFAYIWLSGLATRTEHIKVRRIRNRKKEIIIGVAICGSPRKSPGKNIIRFNKLESCGWPLSFVFAATLPVTRCCCNGIHKKICHCLEPHLWAFFAYRSGCVHFAREINTSSMHMHLGRVHVQCFFCCEYFFIVRISGPIQCSGSFRVAGYSWGHCGHSAICDYTTEKQK